MRDERLEVVEEGGERGEEREFGERESDTGVVLGGHVVFDFFGEEGAEGGGEEGEGVDFFHFFVDW